VSGSGDLGHETYCARCSRPSGLEIRKLPRFAEWTLCEDCVAALVKLGYFYEVSLLRSSELSDTAATWSDEVK
jgi:hypothetical protein